MSGTFVRRGLSLLEVMLALAILGGSLATLGQLVRIGAQAARVSRDSTTAQLLAESRMAEIASGIVLTDNVVQEPVDETGEWLISVETQPVDQQGLLAVQVLVEQDETFNSQPVTFTLTRWIIDPEVEAEARLQAAEIKKSAGANANQGQAAAGGPTDASQLGGAGGLGPGGPGGGGTGGGRPGGNNGSGGNGSGGNNGPGGNGNGPGGGNDGNNGPGGNDDGNNGPRGGGFGGGRGGSGGR